MIKHLLIQNYTLIENLSIPFYPGFSVITGETGAGKSIILGAIGLLLGDRAEPKTIKRGAERCVIEAHFQLSHRNFKDFFDENDLIYDENDTIIRREIYVKGRNRAFINDSPVNINLLKELGELLIDIHSQHQNLLLNKNDFQLGVIDAIAKNEKLLQEYQKTYRQYKLAKKELDVLKENIQSSKDNEEFLRFQLKELKEAHLVNDEQGDLEKQASLLSHTEEIKQSFFTANESLSNDENGILSMLKAVHTNIANIEGINTDIKDLNARVESVCIELDDIAHEIQKQIDSIEYDPELLNNINERLNLIYNLEKKFHAKEIKDLLEKQADIEEQLRHIENFDEELCEKEKHVQTLLFKVEKLSKELTTSRQNISKSISENIINKLDQLGLPYAEFQISITSKPISTDGSDKVDFLFSANKNTSLEKIRKIASGGEISRVMLALKDLLNGVTQLPTIIFDEIDTGISGKIAEQMGVIMKNMGNANRQIISITHQAQIAAKGTKHYKVYKKETDTSTNSYMVELNQEERIHEIAQMLSGALISEAAIENAKSLLQGINNTTDQE